MSAQANVLELGQGFIEAASTAIKALAPDAQILWQSGDSQISASFVNSAAFTRGPEDAIDVVFDAEGKAIHVSVTDTNMTVQETLGSFSFSEGVPGATLLAAAEHFVGLSGLEVKPEELVAAI